jgi:hypothetical protein
MRRLSGRSSRPEISAVLDLSHTCLDRAERVLDRLAPAAHGGGVLVEPPLHGFEYMLAGALRVSSHLPASEIEQGVLYDVLKGDRTIVSASRSRRRSPR